MKRTYFSLSIHIFLGLSLFKPCLVTAEIQVETIYINSGTYEAVDGETFEKLAFNNSDIFNAENVRIQMNNSDTLQLEIINNNIVTHGFNITGIEGLATTIEPGESVIVTAVFEDEGIYLMYDQLNDLDNSFLGLSGMIIAEEFEGGQFYWNLKDHQKSIHDEWSGGGDPSFDNYYPDYFLINGLSNPDINSDESARITGNVGETIRIYIANTGHSVHSLHFHGYHAEVVFSSYRSIDIGRSKDTFAIQSMHSVILELTPDKPGEFPVHDHNLVATAGGGIYPNGMFMTMLID